MVKPLDFGELLANARIAVEHRCVYRFVHCLKQRLQYCYDDLRDVEELLKNNSHAEDWMGLSITKPKKPETNKDL